MRFSEASWSSIESAVTAQEAQAVQTLLEGPMLVEGVRKGSRSTPTGQAPRPLLSCSCQCQEYVSAEELCDAQCLAKAPHLSLAWGPNRELILSVKGEAGDSDQRVSSPQGRAGIEG